MSNCIDCGKHLAMDDAEHAVRSHTGRCIRCDAKNEGWQKGYAACLKNARDEFLAAAIFDMRGKYEISHEKLDEILPVPGPETRKHWQI